LKLRAGIVGAGMISRVYLENARHFDSVEIVACADLIREKAEERAAEFGVKACEVDELLESPDIDLVINLTVPQAHAPINIKALEEGKHVYSEKPLAVTPEDARKVLELARSKGLRVGCAPDTFMGGALQTCLKAINDGLIGTPIGASAFHVSIGPDTFHPSPDFFFQPGGGPLFDMGVYYLTALVALLGPIESVSAFARITFPERFAVSTGKNIRVETPTFFSGSIRFAQGAICTMLSSFDLKGGTAHPPLEIYGSEGTLRGPNPTTFQGPVMIRNNFSSEWREIPIRHSFIGTKNYRGIGVGEMARAILTGREHRASGELAFHVLETMHGFLVSSERNAAYTLTSTCEKPAHLPEGLAEYAFDGNGGIFPE